MRGPRSFLALLLLVVSAACSSPAPVDAPQRSAAPPARAMDIATAVARLPMLPSRGTLVVRATGRHFLVYREPGSPLTWKLLADNPWDQPLEFPVLGTLRAPDGAPWLRVALPIRPNGTTGWVKAADVRWHRIDQRIVVDLSQHTLWRYVDGRMVRQLSVAVGAPSTPTTPGSFFVWARVTYAHPNGPYGAAALGLSGFSRVLTNWPGGGRLAIHGTANPGDIGRDVSHGCVRVDNPDLLAYLRGVPLGTPVVIRP